jgi:hypothetical protein
MESAASERYSIFRKCRLEDIQIPLIEGKLEIVPITEVRLSAPPHLFRC